MAIAEVLHTKSQPILESLEIRNYRAFNHLLIPRLGQVNLITGKNNIGKSSLLEACLLYAKSCSPVVLRELLDNRDELRAPNEMKERGALTTGRVLQEEEVNISAAKHLFHGRKNVDDVPAPISIGANLARGSAVSMELGWYVTEMITSEDQLEQPTARHLRLVPKQERYEYDDAALYLVARSNDRQLYRLRLDRLVARIGVRSLLELPAINSQYIRSAGLDDSQISRLWDSITATALEENVLTALRLIAPELERIVVVGDAERSGSRGRVPLAKMSGEERIPLRSFGDGMNRLFGITLGLVNSQNGIFLADEIDTGMHFSVLPSLWRFIFRVAYQLNIQVIVTTHSWDCIQAFQEAAEYEDQNEGILVRLEAKSGEVKATVFDERRLAIVTREQIEVR